MEKSFSFGIYTCYISGEDELLKLIPEQWTGYEGKQHFVSAVKIHLKKTFIENEGGLSDGWIYRNSHGISEVKYILRGKTGFILQYDKPKEITVFISNIFRQFICLGIQFGIMLALNDQCIGLHGVTLLCGNEFIILSAPSGTGKTTLAKMLEKYCDATIINGDFALLTPTEKGVYYEPTPFCGSSRRNLNHRFPVNRVVFLGQAKENCWRTLNGREAMARFMSNTFVPTWERSMQEAVQESVLRCVETLKINAYDFAPTQIAAELFLQRMVDSSFC